MATDHDAERCRHCGWPTHESTKEGCTAGNCSQRPIPTRDDRRPSVSVSSSDSDRRPGACPDCGGLGSVVVGLGALGCVVDCPDCGGSGKAKALEAEKARADAAEAARDAAVARAEAAEKDRDMALAAVDHFGDRAGEAERQAVAAGRGCAAGVPESTQPIVGHSVDPARPTHQPDTTGGPARPGE